MKTWLSLLNPFCLSFFSSVQTGGNVPAQLPTGFFHKVCVDSEFEASCNVSILVDNFR